MWTDFVWILRVFRLNPKTLSTFHHWVLPLVLGDTGVTLVWMTVRVVRPKRLRWGVSHGLLPTYRQLLRFCLWRSQHGIFICI
jgi:hypothetical protein